MTGAGGPESREVGRGGGAAVGGWLVRERDVGKLKIIIDPFYFSTDSDGREILTWLRSTHGLEISGVVKRFGCGSGGERYAQCLICNRLLV